MRVNFSIRRRRLELPGVVLITVGLILTAGTTDGGGVIPFHEVLINVAIGLVVMLIGFLLARYARAHR